MGRRCRGVKGLHLSGCHFRVGRKGAAALQQIAPPNVASFPTPDFIIRTSIFPPLFFSLESLSWATIKTRSGRFVFRFNDECSRGAENGFAEQDIQHLLPMRMQRSDSSEKQARREPEEPDRWIDSRRISE